MRIGRKEAAGLIGIYAAYLFYMFVALKDDIN